MLTSQHANAQAECRSFSRSSQPPQAAVPQTQTAAAAQPASSPMEVEAAVVEVEMEAEVASPLAMAGRVKDSRRTPSPAPYPARQRRVLMLRWKPGPPNAARRERRQNARCARRTGLARGARRAPSSQQRLSRCPARIEFGRRRFSRLSMLSTMAVTPAR